MTIPATLVNGDLVGTALDSTYRICFKSMWAGMSTEERYEWIRTDGGEQCYTGNKYRDMARDARFARLRRPLWAPTATLRAVLGAVDGTMTDEDWIASVTAQEPLSY